MIVQRFTRPTVAVAMAYACAACGASRSTAPIAPATEVGSGSAPAGSRAPEPEQCDELPPTTAKLVTVVEHTGCFGKCAAYAIAVYADGTVAYHGFAYVAVRGSRVKRVDVAIVAELVHDFEALRFSSLPDYNSPRYTDGPAITVQYGLSIVHEAVGDDAIPPALTTLEHRIDDLVGVTPSPSGAGRSRGECPIRPTLQEARIIQQTETGGDLRLIVGIGRDQGITQAWQPHLIAGDTNQLLTSAAATIEVRAHMTTVTTRATPEAKHATVIRFSPPSP